MPLDPVSLDPMPDVGRFVSLGLNCELGLVQERCGVSPLSLFRFSYTPIDGLRRVLTARFDGWNSDDQWDVVVEPFGELTLVHRDLGFRFHTFVRPDQQPADVVKRSFVTRWMPLLERKFVEEIAEGTQIAVRMSEDWHDADAPFRLLDALGHIGAPRLLWIMCDPAKAGKVEVADDRLMIGYLDRFGEPATNLSFECWLSVCRNALDAIAVR